MFNSMIRFCQSRQEAGCHLKRSTTVRMKLGKTCHGFVQFALTKSSGHNLKHVPVLLWNMECPRIVELLGRFGAAQAIFQVFGLETAAGNPTAEDRVQNCC